MSGGIAAVSAAAVGALSALLAAWISFRLARKTEIQSYEIRDALMVAEELRHQQVREMTEGARFRELLPTLIQKIPEATLDQWIAQLGTHAEVNNVTHFAGDVFVQSIDAGVEKAKLTQEIAHSLRTPLAQIEAAALTLQGGINLDAASAAVARIQQGVEICKCFVSAYRSYGRIQGEIGGWSPKSISGMLQSALRFYVEGAGKEVVFRCENLPDRLAGYSNDFVVAALLPILENAAEATPSSGMICLSFTNGADESSFHLANDYSGPELTRDIFNRGSSTKHEHEGIGLSVSRGLVEGFAGGSITVSTGTDQAIFTVSLPKGEEDVQSPRS